MFLGPKVVTSLVVAAWWFTISYNTKTYMKVSNMNSQNYLYHLSTPYLRPEVLNLFVFITNLKHGVVESNRYTNNHWWLLIITCKTQCSYTWPHATCLVCHIKFFRVPRSTLVQIIKLKATKLKVNQGNLNHLYALSCCFIQQKQSCQSWESKGTPKHDNPFQELRLNTAFHQRLVTVIVP